MARPSRFAVALVAMSLAAGALAPRLALGSESGPPPRKSLIRLDLTVPPEEIGLPIHALLRDAAGTDYALVLADPAEAAAYGAIVIDSNAVGAAYLVALERRDGARAAAREIMPILLDDGRHVVVRSVPGRADTLARLGFDLALFSQEPMVFLPAPETVAVPEVTYDPRVANIISAVTQPTVFAYNGNLSGETAVSIGGDDYTIVTRHTNSGEPITKATQYVYEFMEQYGLDVSYHQWSSGRNVIGEKLGATDPDEIVLITAHLDDMPSGPIAPGADDNGSGSVGVMLAAQHFEQYWFEKTIRFVFFTGEEQGLLGSQAYAAQVQADGDNIVAVYNMDMIAWDAIDGPTLRIHTRPSNALDLAIATTFEDVVATYGLAGSLTTIIDQDGISASDHASFWSQGFPGVLAIEDDNDDFNAYYHTVNDTRANLNMAYFTNYVKASLGTVAHLAVPTIAPCQQAMAPVGVDVDVATSGSTVSNANGVFEKGERVLVAPTWRYPGGCLPRQVTGASSDLSGPSGLLLSVPDDGASYGLLVGGEVANCYDATGNCYEMRVSPVGSRPDGHVDLQVTEDLSTNRSALITLHLGESFTDVPVDRWAYRFIETVLHEGITSGCTTTTYCPDADVTRWQMSVFLSRAIAEGQVPVAGTIPGLGDYDCTAGGQSVFVDVPPTDGGCPYIHFVAAREVTVGCGGGAFCPATSVDRWQMGVFLAKSMTDPATIPVSGTVPGRGSYDCSEGGESVFSDISPTDPACRYIHFIAAEGVTSGCGGDDYCPHSIVTRDQMAVFITKAFGLELAEIEVQ